MKIRISANTWSLCTTGLAQIQRLIRSCHSGPRRYLIHSGLRPTNFAPVHCSFFVIQTTLPLDEKSLVCGPVLLLMQTLYPHTPRSQKAWRVAEEWGRERLNIDGTDYWIRRRLNTGPRRVYTIPLQALLMQHGGRRRYCP